MARAATPDKAWKAPLDQRRAADPAIWGDTVPACFRSEAFAEDLFDVVGGPPAAARRTPVLRWALVLLVAAAALVGWFSR